MIATYIHFKYVFSILFYIIFLLSFLYIFKKNILILICILALILLFQLRFQNIISYQLPDNDYLFFVKEKTSDTFYTIKVNKLNFTLYSKEILEEGCYYTAFLRFNNLNSTANFFEFNYSKYLNSQKIFYRVYAKNIKKSDKKNLFYYYRSRFSCKLYELWSENKGYLLASSLIFNERKSKKKLYAIFQNLNISHFIAFSGMHLGVFLAINDKFFKKIKYTNYFVVIVAFILSNFSFSCLRALYIYFVDKLAHYFGRPAYSLENLGIFTIITMLYNPLIIYNPSFFYSVIFYSQIVIFNKEKLKLTLLFALESLFIMKSLSIYYVFLNFALIIIFPFIIISSILFFIFFNFQYSYILLIPNKIVINLLEFLYKYNYTINLNFKYIMIFLILFFLFFKKKKLLFLLVCLFLYFQLFPYIIVFDTGHGQSILFNWTGKYILFDGGNNYYKFNTTLENFLTLSGKNINTVLISHNDNDHFSGLIDIDQNKFIMKLYLPDFNSKLLYGDILKKDNYNINSKLYSLDFIREKSDNRNNYSFFYNLKVFNKKIFFCSDLSSEKSLKYMSLYENNSDYLFVGHHGGKNSLSRDIIEKNSKALFIISCSNQYNNPHKQTLELLSNSNYISTKKHGAIFIDVLTGLKIMHFKNVQ